MSNWSKLTKSYVLATEKMRWQFICLRACCLLACIRDNPKKRSSYLKGGAKCVRLLRKRKDSAFRCYGDVFEVLFAIQANSYVAPGRWEAALRRLDDQHQRLYATALRWQMAIHQGDEEGCERAKQQFMDRGVVDPERLMNILFPLPSGSR